MSVKNTSYDRTCVGVSNAADTGCHAGAFRVGSFRAGVGVHGLQRVDACTYRTP